MRDTIKDILTDGAALRARLSADSEFIGQIQLSATEMLEASQRGGTIYSCGNGGSGCDAMHLTEELVARFKRERPGIRAMHFMDPGTLSCWANDYSYEQAFARQVSTFCTERDVLVAISTSGNSNNVIAAVEAAKATKTYTVGLLGKGGGKLAKLVDCPLIVPAQETERIQEMHITIIHIWMELMEMPPPRT